MRSANLREGASGASTSQSLVNRTVAALSVDFGGLTLMAWTGAVHREVHDIEKLRIVKVDGERYVLLLVTHSH